MHDHMPRHGKKASQHGKAGVALWKPCRLQTYFTAKGLIDYFVVEAAASPGPSAANESAAVGPGTSTQTLSPPCKEETELFESLKKDLKTAVLDLNKKAARVEDTGNSRTDREPWLVRTQFPAHLQGLDGAEIKSSYRLPRAAGGTVGGWSGNNDDDDDAGGSEEARAESDLARILVSAEAMLRDAYALCSDRSPDGKMTYQRAVALSDFTERHSEGKGKVPAFRPFKNESSLTTYFRTAKELLAYYYRVVYREDGHFTRDTEDQVLPREVIKPSRQQRETMGQIIEALGAVKRADEDAGGRGDREEEPSPSDLALRHAIRKFYLSLLYQKVGSVPFRSALLSFCAMRSRVASFGGGGGGKGRGRKAEARGLVWAEPMNFTSHIPAIIWVMQLVVFDYACICMQDDEDGILDIIRLMVGKAFCVRDETPISHVLAWRNYLGKIGKSAITRHQARWSQDEQTLTLNGVTLCMDHVRQLLVSEYRQAYALLFDELLLGADDIPPVESWRVHDDLDLEDYGGSWLTDKRNAEVLPGAQDALLREIQIRTGLRQVFVRDGPAGKKVLCRKAIAIYEAHVQEFLKRLVTLIHVSPCPPLRAPELLSVLYENTARRRNIYVWEKSVMLHVRYHKSLEMTEAPADNVRFLPRAVGDLLLTYLALVQPLRQTFLRQSKPGALLSPHLWATLDGEVWPDTRVTDCLKSACARAETPELTVAWWRQAAASITKAKLSPSQRANFNIQDMEGPEEIEEENDMVSLAVASNHSVDTFNHAYAGTTTLVMNMPLNRAYRASEIWRNLFGVDQALRGKRPRVPADDDDPYASGGILSACKKVQLRKPPALKRDGLVAVARRLYNNPALKLRRPGQEKAMLAALGPQPAEQVVVILGTGSGKSLLFMVAAAMDGAGTTVLVLPTVALGTNMRDRLDKAGVRYHVWHPGPSNKAAPLVIVSAEAACTERFVEYAVLLNSRQQLDRIVVDECHLTVTASNYRRSMSRLGWYVRSVPIQTVWMTATLPPVFEEPFLEHNKLVRPLIVRESTDRPNIRYVVRRERGQGTLTARAAGYVRGFWGREDLVQGERDRVILYCRTKELVAELAALLGCPHYTGDDDYDERMDALNRWLGSAAMPAIVATSALGVGFDYPHVRWVIHVGAPTCMTDFSQETGRAGRDGALAESTVLLSAAWEARSGGPPNADADSMDLFLTQQHCSRGVMSQFLDARSDWKWCMAGDAPCGVCLEPHAERRPTDLKFELPRPDDDEEGASGSDGQDDDDGGNAFTTRSLTYTGPKEILRQRKSNEAVLRRYEQDLETLRGCCALCRLDGKPWEHAASTCSRRFPWIKAKRSTLVECQRQGKNWMAPLTVCFTCFQPQEICRVADPEYKASRVCKYPDVVIPLCYRAFYRDGRALWFRKHFGFVPKTESEYMRWLGTPATLGGARCVEANRVVAILLSELG